MTQERANIPHSENEMPKALSIHALEVPEGELRGAEDYLRKQAEELKATLIAGQVFGDTAGGKGVMRLAGPRLESRAVVGARGLAVRGAERIVHEGREVGWRFADEAAEYGYFPGLTPHCGEGLSAVKQGQAWFDQVEEVLGSGGFAFRDVIRTWFYLDEVGGWYPDFNRLRNAFFDRAGVYEGFVPISTGVGARNAEGKALQADVFCLRSRGETRVEAVSSPLQCPALDYRSAFNRAAEIHLPDRRWLMISGTASITRHGASAHEGDADAQVELSMEVVKAILESRGMGWEAVWRGVTYFREAGIRAAYERWLARHYPQGLPLTPAVCEICRDELLFEVELDAVERRS